MYFYFLTELNRSLCFCGFASAQQLLPFCVILFTWLHRVGVVEVGTMVWDTSRWMVFLVLPRPLSWFDMVDILSCRSFHSVALGFGASRPLVDREQREEVHAPVVRTGRLTLLSQTDDSSHAWVACIARERRGRSSQVEEKRRGPAA